MTVVAEETRHGVRGRLAEAGRRRDRVPCAAQGEGRAEIQRLGPGGADNRADSRRTSLMMMMVVVVVMVLLAGGQAQRVRSEQWRWVVRVGRAAQAQRVRSHEIRCRSCGDCRHLWRGCELLEQGDTVAVIDAGTVAISTRCCRRGRGAEQRIQAHDVRLRGPQLGADFLIVDAGLLEVVDEMAAWPVRAEAYCVEGAAQLGLVFRMAGKIP